MNNPSLRQKYETALTVIKALANEVAELKAKVKELEQYKWMYEDLQ